MNPKITQMVRARDQHCWHCGSMTNLVVHHRANRGMGGSKILDTAQNLIVVCRDYNNLMESDADVAAESRQLGHKLGRYASPSSPVYDAFFQRWYFLDTKGGKTPTDPPQFLL